MVSELTRFQRYALYQIRKRATGWFDPVSPATVFIRRPAHTCELLYKKGALKRRVNPADKSRYSADYWQYHLVETSE